MSLYDCSVHPVGFVRDALAADKCGWRLTFSRYLYTPQAVFDERVFFEVPVEEVDADWVRSQVDHLEPGWELALNSKVLDQRGRAHHIGMIDFAGRTELSTIKERVRQMLGSRALGKIQFYDSGRSLHGYLNTFMSPGDWHQFLGRLLLMNDPAEAPIVDARWVGHRLLGGYAALRWSANSSHYTQVPEKLRI